MKIKIGYLITANEANKIYEILSRIETNDPSKDPRLAFIDDVGEFIFEYGDFEGKDKDYEGATLLLEGTELEHTLFKNYIDNVRTTKCFKVASRWRVFLQGLRIFCTGICLEDSVNGYEFDGKTLDIRYDEENSCIVSELNYGDTEMIFSEDGTPIFLSDWAKESMDIHGIGNDFEVYEFVGGKEA